MSQAKWIFLALTGLALILFIAGMAVAFIKPDCDENASFQCEIEHDNQLQSWSVGMWSVGGLLLIGGAIVFATGLRAQEH